jgi:hypothetical protein
MAGTLVLDTIQDGSGNSTSATNPIRGSAKAWVAFGGMSTGPYNVVYNSHGVSSVTRLAAGSYRVTYTTPFPTNDVCVTLGGTDNGLLEAALVALYYNSATYCNIVAGTPWLGRAAGSIAQDSVLINMAAFY